MDAFPAFFPLRGARVVIAGAGEPAFARARLFEGSPAEIVLLDETWGLDPDSYQGAHLIFIASDDEAFVRAAEAAARTAAAPINVFDRPAVSDFNTPAIIDRGTVVVAVATSGAAPLMAQVLRADIEARLPPNVGRTASMLGARRGAIKAAFPDLADRRSFLRAVLANPDLDEVALDAAIAGGLTAVGRLVIIDLPPAEDLLSLRAVQALGAAEVVAGSEGARRLIDRHARRDALRLTPAEATPDRLLGVARSGRIAVVVDASPTLAAALGGEAVEILRFAAEGR